MAAVYDQFDDPVGRVIIIKADGSDGNSFPVVAGDVYIGRCVRIAGCTIPCFTLQPSLAEMPTATSAFERNVYPVNTLF